VVAIATTDRHSPQQIALNEVARRAITADPAWQEGRYEPGRGPAAGLSVARMLGHVTYLSNESMTAKFGRRVRGGSPAFHLDPDFEVEHYLDHQGRKFVDRFDANTLLYITRALDYFDMVGHHQSLAAALASTEARFLLLAFSSDWLYPARDMERLARDLTDAGKEVEYRCIESPNGHDSFLLENPKQAMLVRRFLDDDSRFDHPLLFTGASLTSP
jgi:homoserine O-acetyltransferase